MTAQIGEYLRYRGEGVSMCTEPLGDYFAMGGRMPEFQANCTALWRGYVGGWEIVAGRLYLVKLTGTLMDGSEACLETVFPGFPERVFAHWYTGTLRIPRGQRLRYRHSGYDSIHERDEMLEFEQGVIRRTWVRNNGQAEPDDSKPQGYAAGARTVLAQPRSSGTPSSSAGERR
jgi:hypothetical protein